MSIKLDVKFRSWYGAEILEKMVKAALKAEYYASNAVLTQAKQEVPLDEGPLKNSGIVIYKWQGINPVSCITFGGGKGTGIPKIPYAVRWHENSANFQRGRKRFYLRDPFNRLGETAFRNALIMCMAEAFR
jgi:hypothetical protein